MPFTQGFAFPDLKVPGKLYEHSSHKAYFKKDLPEKLSKEMLSRVLKMTNSPRESDYFLSILWAESESAPVLDFFAYRLDNSREWRGNAGELSWIVRDGLWRRPTENEENTCEEGHILIADELTLRRKIPKEEYLKTIIDIREVNEKLKFQY